MADKQITVKKLTKISKKISLDQVKRNKRNKSRRLRRKRSKLRIKEHLRIRKITNRLHRSVHVYDISHMENTSQYQPSLQDVAQWQAQHQIAYWKSRAIALEYENQMLHTQIKKFYTNQIEEYVKAMDVLDISTNEEVDEPVNLLPRWEVVKENELSKPPQEPVGKAKKDEMIRLYGKTAPKINGMETAIQLNYDYQIDKHNPPYWPNLPLNL